RNHFDESIAERVGRHSESPDVLCGRNMLLDRRVNRALMDERPARGLDELEPAGADGLVMSGADLGDLTGTAGDGSLVTTDTTGAVVHVPQSAAFRFLFGGAAPTNPALALDRAIACRLLRRQDRLDIFEDRAVPGE